MNFIKKNYIFLTLIVFIGTSTVLNAMFLRTVQQLSIIKPFCTPSTINTIRNVMDTIETRKLGYDDYSNRTGLIWSDVAVNTQQAKIIQEIATKKVTQVRGTLSEIKPQSILQYPTLTSVVSDEILPKMFESVSVWTKLPETVFTQIFFQRCSTSEAMDWHQDPGEDYTPQSDYSLVLMLSEQDDPTYGWTDGKFKIRSGLPEDTFAQTDVDTIIPQCNQGILFNNLLNTHAVEAVTPKMEKAKRDIMVILLALNKLPLEKTQME